MDDEKTRWRRLRAALGHVGLLLTLTVYTAAGGLIFRELERPAEVARLAALRGNVARQRHRMIASVVNNTDVSNLATLVSVELATYERALQEAVRGGVSVPVEAGQAAAAGARWSFVQAVFFASTVLTTIGYGNIVPVTFWGRAFCVVFALVGLPLTLGVVADMGRLFAGGVSAAWARLPPGARARLAPPASGVGAAGRRSLSALAAVLFLLLYLAAGAGLFMLWEEEWGFFEGFYFCFVTMTTIGFGDLVPKKPKYMLLCTVYILVGLALTSTIFELVRKQYARSWRRLQELSGPLGDALRRLGEGAGGGIDTAALTRFLAVAGAPKFRHGGSHSAKQQREWEEAMAQVLKDIAGPKKKQPPVVQIVLYESSV
ncbi:TWiK family of potassium channels protein 7 [Bacillus rossius redtenbacheri]|uniref:TWiK family of potassium channels protein 7 n=1 Tax=Bacillus rossius redtenbacheri TaxID=93214 RepID=UPI002FDE182C